MQVLLVDDHVMFRQGLKFLLSDLEESLRFLEAGTTKQAINLLASEQVNLILLDLNMPGESGLEGLEQVISAAKGVPVAVLSGENDPEVIRSAIEVGASGFVVKAASAEILVAALQLILAGGIYLPESVLGSTRDTGRVRATVDSGADQVSQLSKRQTAVLLRAIQGQANKVIAIDMGIAEGTVKTHLSTAYRVLGVNNRTEAVFAAAKLGLKPLAGDDD